MTSAGLPPATPESDAGLFAGTLASSAAFGPPRFDFDTVATRALSLVLQAEPLPKLITVCAPPGYGKTVLLSRLHQEFAGRGHGCCWVSLDDRDTDLSSLIYKVRAALLEFPAVRAAEPASSASLFRDRATSTDSLIHLLALLPRPATLFIDNLGFCDDSALGHFLERLVFGTQATLHLILSSIREVPVDSVRAKLEVGALELRAAQLSFDRLSTSRLLQQAGLTPANDSDLDRILAQTEGWPAAVRLLQVLLTGEHAVPDATSPDIGQVLQRFGGDHNDIARVLTRRVLVGFDPALVQFMIEIALLREFSADFAAHTTGRPEAREWLNLLVARNVLIFPLDRNRRWFRFHTLLREFLLAESQDCVTQQRRRELLNRAAEWHVEHGDNVTAISLALEAGAVRLAQDLLDRIAHVVVGDHGQMGTLIQWVDRLQAAGVEPSVEAHAWFVWALCDSLQYERASRALDDFDRRVAATPSAAQDIDAIPSRLLFVRALVNVWVDRLDTAYEQAKAWLDRGDIPDALTLSTVNGIAGIAEIDQGELSAARMRLAQASAAIARSDSAYGSAWVAILRACVEIGQARPDAADELLLHAHEQVSRVIGVNADVVVTMEFVRARALLDLGRMDAARDLAVRGLGRAMHHGIILSLEQGLTAAAAFWHDRPDDPVSSALLDRVAHSFPARGRAFLASNQVRRLIQLGRASDAQAMADRHGMTHSLQRVGQTVPMRERGDWLLARLELLLAQGACEDLLTQIEPLLKAARTQERHRDRVELLLLATEAHQRLGQLRMAVRQLSLAIVLAAPGKLIQPFKMRQSLLGLVLSEVSDKEFGLTRETEWSFLERLRALDVAPAAAQADRPGQRAGDEAGPVTLGVPTLREIQLITLLDQGLNNEQVADRLSLSVPTVKWHLHNLYVKLGVRSRSAALARARALNLIGR